MTFKSKFSNIFIISIMLSTPLKAEVSMSESKGDSQSHQFKSLGKEEFAYQENISHQLIGSRIITQFAPKNSKGENIDLNKLASSLGYDHFNWVSYVEKDPYGIENQSGHKLHTPYNDPPQGGYLGDPADQLPFYWDIVSCINCQPRYHLQDSHNLSLYKLVFEDSPADYRLQPGESIEFVTNLVGVKQYDLEQQTAEWDILHTFRWQLTNYYPNLSEVSLLEENVALDKLSSLLLSKMQLDGAVLITGY
jgi:hypothetical protein